MPSNTTSILIKKVAIPPVLTFLVAITKLAEYHRGRGRGLNRLFASTRRMPCLARKRLPPGLTEEK